MLKTKQKRRRRRRGPHKSPNERECHVSQKRRLALIYILKRLKLGKTVVIYSGGISASRAGYGANTTYKQ